MKACIILAISLMGFSAAAAPGQKYFCMMDDGSDWSVRIDFEKKTARLMAEDVDTTYHYSGAFESLPPQYVFGDRQDCYIKFRPSRDARSGQASFRCNKQKYPYSVELDLDCLAQ